MGDGVGAGVVTSRSQFLAQVKDGGLDLGCELVRAGPWSSRARL
jgi:hypothetical protein